MKNIFSIVITICFIFSLCSCGGNTDSVQNQNQKNENTSTVQTPKDQTINDTAPEEEIHKDLNIPIDENFTIVEAKYSTHELINDEVTVSLKIKNNTPNNYEMVDFQFHSYDKNGDRVGSHYLGTSDIEADHSTWITGISTDMTLDTFYSIKIEYYSILARDPERLSTFNKISEKYLEPKPEVSINDMTEKKQ